MFRNFSNYFFLWHFLAGGQKHTQLSEMSPCGSLRHLWWSSQGRKRSLFNVKSHSGPLSKGRRSRQPGLQAYSTTSCLGLRLLQQRKCSRHVEPSNLLVFCSDDCSNGPSHESRCEALVQFMPETTYFLWDIRIVKEFYCIHYCYRHHLFWFH